jgi:SAM-dependent methyltransferase
MRSDEIHCDAEDIPRRRRTQRDSHRRTIITAARLGLNTFYDDRRTDIPIIDARLKAVSKLIAKISPSHVLDLACGRGVLLQHLAAILPKATLVGADIAPSSLEYVKDLGFEAHVADISRGLPFADEQFDCVIFGELIEHLVDPDFALQQISRVLSRGGQLILTTPNLASWFNRLLLLAGIQPIATETSLYVNLGRRIRFLGQWRPTQGHLKLFTRDALLEMLQGNGYRVSHVLGAPFAEKNPASLLDALIAKRPSLASNFIVQATNLRTLKTEYPSAEGWH